MPASGNFYQFDRVEKVSKNNCSINIFNFTPNRQNAKPVISMKKCIFYGYQGKYEPFNLLYKVVEVFATNQDHDYCTCIKDIRIKSKFPEAFPSLANHHEGIIIDIDQNTVYVGSGRWVCCLPLSVVEKYVIPSRIKVRLPLSVKFVDKWKIVNGCKVWNAEFMKVLDDSARLTKNYLRRMSQLSESSDITAHPSSSVSKGVLPDVVSGLKDIKTLSPIHQEEVFQSLKDNYVPNENDHKKSCPKGNEISQDVSSSCKRNHDEETKQNLDLQFKLTKDVAKSTPSKSQTVIATSKTEFLKINQCTNTIELKDSNFPSPLKIKVNSGTFLPDAQNCEVLTDGNTNIGTNLLVTMNNEQETIRPIETYAIDRQSFTETSVSEVKANAIESNQYLVNNSDEQNIVNKDVNTTRSQPEVDNVNKLIAIGKGFNQTSVAPVVPETNFNVEHNTTCTPVDTEVKNIKFSSEIQNKIEKNEDPASLEEVKTPAIVLDLQTNGSEATCSYSEVNDSNNAENNLEQREMYEVVLPENKVINKCMDKECVMDNSGKSTTPSNVEIPIVTENQIKNCIPLKQNENLSIAESDFFKHEDRTDATDLTAEGSGKTTSFPIQIENKKESRTQSSKPDMLVVKEDFVPLNVMSDPNIQLSFNRLEAKLSFGETNSKQTNENDKNTDEDDADIVYPRLYLEDTIQALSNMTQLLDINAQDKLMRIIRRTTNSSQDVESIFKGYIENFKGIKEEIRSRSSHDITEEDIDKQTTETINLLLDFKDNLLTRTSKTYSNLPSQEATGNKIIPQMTEELVKQTDHLHSNIYPKELQNEIESKICDCFNDCQCDENIIDGKPSAVNCAEISIDKIKFDDKTNKELSTSIECKEIKETHPTESLELKASSNESCIDQEISNDNLSSTTISVFENEANDCNKHDVSENENIDNNHEIKKKQNNSDLLNQNNTDFANENNSEKSNETLSYTSESPSLIDAKDDQPSVEIENEERHQKTDLLIISGNLESNVHSGSEITERTDKHLIDTNNDAVMQNPVIESQCSNPVANLTKSFETTNRRTEESGSTKSEPVVKRVIKADVQCTLNDIDSKDNSSTDTCCDTSAYSTGQNSSPSQYSFNNKQDSLNLDSDNVTVPVETIHDISSCVTINTSQTSYTSTNLSTSSSSGSTLNNESYQTRNTSDFQSSYCSTCDISTSVSSIGIKDHSRRINPSDKSVHIVEEYNLLETTVSEDCINRISSSPIVTQDLKSRDASFSTYLSSSSCINTTFSPNAGNSLKDASFDSIRNSSFKEQITVPSLDNVPSIIMKDAIKKDNCKSSSSSMSSNLDTSLNYTNCVSDEEEDIQQTNLSSSRIRDHLENIINVNTNSEKSEHNADSLDNENFELDSKSEGNQSTTKIINKDKNSDETSDLIENDLIEAGKIRNISCCDNFVTSMDDFDCSKSSKSVFSDSDITDYEYDSENDAIMTPGLSPCSTDASSSNKMDISKEGKSNNDDAEIESTKSDISICDLVQSNNGSTVKKKRKISYHEVYTSSNDSDGSYESYAFTDYVYDSESGDRISRTSEIEYNLDTSTRDMSFKKDASMEETSHCFEGFEANNDSIINNSNLSSDVNKSQDKFIILSSDVNLGVAALQDEDCENCEDHSSVILDDKKCDCKVFEADKSIITLNVVDGSCFGKSHTSDVEFIGEIVSEAVKMYSENASNISKEDLHCHRDNVTQSVNISNEQFSDEVQENDRINMELNECKKKIIPACSFNLNNSSPDSYLEDSSESSLSEESLLEKSPVKKKVIPIISNKTNESETDIELIYDSTKSFNETFDPSLKIEDLEVSALPKINCNSSFSTSKINLKLLADVIGETDNFPTVFDSRRNTIHSECLEYDLVRFRSSMPDLDFVHSKLSGSENDLSNVFASSYNSKASFINTIDISKSFDKIDENPPDIVTIDRKADISVIELQRNSTIDDSLTLKDPEDSNQNPEIIVLDCQESTPVYALNKVFHEQKIKPECINQKPTSVKEPECIALDESTKVDINDNQKMTSLNGIEMYPITDLKDDFNISKANDSNIETETVSEIVQDQSNLNFDENHGKDQNLDLVYNKIRSALDKFPLNCKKLSSSKPSEEQIALMPINTTNKNQPLIVTNSDHNPAKKSTKKKSRIHDCQNLESLHDLSPTLNESGQTGDELDILLLNSERRMSPLKRFYTKWKLFLILGGSSVLMTILVLIYKNNK